MKFCIFFEILNGNWKLLLPLQRFLLHITLYGIFPFKIKTEVIIEIHR